MFLATSNPSSTTLDALEHIAARYVVNADRVADALLSRISRLADERRNLFDSLAASVEMVETGDLDFGAVGIDD